MFGKLAQAIPGIPSASLVEAGWAPSRFAPFNATGSEIANWVIDDADGGSGAAVTEVSGRAWLTAPNGASGAGSFLFNNDRAFIFRPAATITGPFEWRVRYEMQNEAFNANVTDVSGFRAATAIIADATYNSQFPNAMAVGAVSSTGTNVAAMWLTNDHNQSLADAAALNEDLLFASGSYLFDWKIVRRATDLQVFDFSYRRPSSGSLDIWDDSEAFTSYVTIDRSDNTTPDRDAFGATANQAVPLSDAVFCGFTIHSNNAVTDTSIRIDRSAMRGTTD